MLRGHSTTMVNKVLLLVKKYCFIIQSLPQ
jgi:hypothetical protein